MYGQEIADKYAFYLLNVHFPLWFHEVMWF